MPAPATQPGREGPATPTSSHRTPESAAGAGFVVSRDEVLAKRAALLAEAYDFQSFLDRIWDQLRMEPMGGDPVSHDVGKAVTYRIRDAEDSYFTVCQSWVNNLFHTADAMADTARQYGFTDDDIAASFTSGPTGA